MCNVQLIIRSISNVNSVCVSTALSIGRDIFSRLKVRYHYRFILKQAYCLYVSAKSEPVYLVREQTGGWKGGRRLYIPTSEDTGEDLPGVGVKSPEGRLRSTHHPLSPLSLTPYIRFARLCSPVLVAREVGACN